MNCTQYVSDGQTRLSRQGENILKYRANDRLCKTNEVRLSHREQTDQMLLSKEE